MSRFGEPWGGTAVSQSVSQYEVHKAQIRCFNRNMKLNSMKRVTDAAAAPDFKRLKDTRSVSRRFKHSLMGLTKEDFLQPLKLCGNTFSADFGDWKSLELKTDSVLLSQRSDFLACVRFGLCCDGHFGNFSPSPPSPLFMLSLRGTEKFFCCLRRREVGTASVDPAP